MSPIRHSIYRKKKQLNIQAMNLLAHVHALLSSNCYLNMVSGFDQPKLILV